MAEHLTPQPGDRVRLIKPLTWEGRESGLHPDISGPAQGVGATGVATEVAAHEGHHIARMYVDWDNDGPHGCDINCIEIIRPDLPPSLDRDAVEAWLNT